MPVTLNGGMRMPSWSVFCVLFIIIITTVTINVIFKVAKIEPYQYCDPHETIREHKLIHKLIVRSTIGETVYRWNSIHNEKLNNVIAETNRNVFKRC